VSTPSPRATATPTTAPTEATTQKGTRIPTPIPSPVALEPPSDLKRAAVVEQDGVRVRVELERNPMPAGEVTRVTTVVKNLEDRPLHWLSDGCAIPVSVAGVAAQDWPKGEKHPPQAQLFKDLVLDRAFRLQPFVGPVADFVPLKWLGKGTFGCADVGIDHTIAPHGSVREVQAWDGQAALRFGPFPAGPVELQGRFGSYWRGREMPEQARHLGYTLEAWVTGGPGDDWLGPVGIVDAALGDQAFLDYLADQDLTSGRDEILWYRPELDVWEVGVLAWYDAPTPQMHLLHVDPRTGEVLRTVDRPWDQRLDGFP
jgi:hypothetical protein